MLSALVVGLPIILINMLLQSLATMWCIRFYNKRVLDRDSLVAGVLGLFGITTIVILGNLLQIVTWGGLFVFLGEFDNLHDAIYHSGVNFATLGYGDIVMSEKWKLLGPIEAVNGALMIGLSGASMLAVLQQYVQKK
ncbi:ion channel [Shewanella bicestrii]|uniref:Ion channel n=1 Tax=Shewanella seohaensis TaxID=755175 RepID=A0ABV4VXN0_9GAMM|nr:MULTISPECIES: ion channel [unclassified Shewanella]MDH0448988.1 potassium channel family protein [Shewanella sp. GD04112]MDH1470684.1 potassium channel family protein [Shewanella sp. GD03713]QXN26648.1 potassium channel family protein [Shewanella putrefaciens]VEE64632.1 Ion channel [Shewanella putrefaciens]